MGVVHCDVEETCRARSDVNINMCSKTTFNCCLQDMSDLGADVNKAVVATLDEDTARQHCQSVLRPNIAISEFAFARIRCI